MRLFLAFILLFGMLSCDNKADQKQKVDVIELDSSVKPLMHSMNKGLGLPLLHSTPFNL